jgi:hypothetical protein
MLAMLEGRFLTHTTIRVGAGCQSFIVVPKVLRRDEEKVSKG